MIDTLSNLSRTHCLKFSTVNQPKRLHRVNTEKNWWLSDLACPELFISIISYLLDERDIFGQSIVYSKDGDYYKSFNILFPTFKMIKMPNIIRIKQL